MSGILKGIGKVFKKALKLVKKIALPALAIAAVVMTGGAAIGALPALGSVLGAGGLGLSAGLTGVLTTAASGATMGAITSAVTGGNIVKGASLGFATGGALGALTGAGSAAAAAAKAGTTAAGSAATGAAPSLGLDSLTQAGRAAASAVPTAAAPVAAAAAPVAAAVPVAAPLTAAAAAPGATGIGSGILSSAPASGGILGFMQANPTLTGSVIQGVGSGIAAKAQAKESRRVEDQRRASYDGYEGTLADTATAGAAPSLAARLVRDPATGRISVKVN